MNIWSTLVDLSMRKYFILKLFWMFLEAHSTPFSQQVKPIISKAHSKKEFWFFHQIFFLAFNSRDMTILWVLNLFSRSSPTKLWKRIFDKMSQKFFVTLKVSKWWDFLILTPWEMSNLGQKFRWKLFFFQQNFFMFINSMRTCFASSRDCGKLLKMSFN